MRSFHPGEVHSTWISSGLVPNFDFRLPPSPPGLGHWTRRRVLRFGNKTDYPTGRVPNLDRTCEQLVQSACGEFSANSFRAINANLTGSMDTYPRVCLPKIAFTASMPSASIGSLSGR